MREAQEVERLRWAVATVSSILFRKAAKLDDSRFVGMQWKAEPHESLTQLSQKPLGFLPMLPFSLPIFCMLFRWALSPRMNS
jgi:hypothetical protein